MPQDLKNLNHSLQSNNFHAEFSLISYPEELRILSYGYISVI